MIERRSLAMGEVRAESRTLSGYAIVYGAEARINGGLETIAAGAVSESLASGRDILALVDHDASRVLGRTKSGTLRLVEDARGLAFTIDLPDTSAARDILALAERGDLGGMSFGFSVPAGGDEWRGNKRTVRKLALHEISVIASHPAYTSTSVEARAASNELELLRLRLELYR
ncbi:HK97 family phage prohead protease [Sphingobium indicum]|uniref:HK97 family phage prohead protease n=1 Tax=Sphingobium indicum TaxID=332055 RepID=UPI0035EC7A37